MIQHIFPFFASFNSGLDHLSTSICHGRFVIQIKPDNQKPERRHRQNARSKERSRGKVGKKERKKTKKERKQERKMKEEQRVWESNLLETANIRGVNCRILVLLPIFHSFPPIFLSLPDDRFPLSQNGHATGIFLVIGYIRKYCSFLI